MSEFEWIEKYLAPLAGEGAFGLQDDAALLALPKAEHGDSEQHLVVTQDAIAENIHFLPDDPLDLVARKALRVNVSDIIAKGATPFAYSLALGLPDTWEDVEMERFTAGLAVDQETYGISLTGGDTYRSPAGLCLAVTFFGAVAKENYKSRMGAKPGDRIVVSGTIGDAAIGLQVALGKVQVEAELAQPHLDAYRLPNPPYGLREAIARYASASMDISDGLVGDCRKLCQASGVFGVLDVEKIPLAQRNQDLIAAKPSLLATALTGGDDYQVLCTIPEDQWTAFQASAAEAKVAVTSIGVVEALEKASADNGTGNLSLMRNGDSVSLDSESFSHF